MSGSETEGAPRRVVIRDLVLAFEIGVRDDEKGRRQPVCINLELFVPEEGPVTSDDIADVVSYSDVIAKIRGLAEQGHINLLETLAERIAAAALSDKRVSHVRVLVEKPDIVPEAAGVGVAIERRRGES